MKIETLIAPTALRDYARSKGWSLDRTATKDRLYVLAHPAFDRRQLVFPMDTTAPDYAEAVMLVVDKLSAIEGRTQRAILKSLVEVNDDGLSFRVITARPDDRSLPLAFAGSMVTGVQQLLLASACAVLKPQAHHPRLSRTEAQLFLDAARFRHTQPGSFVLNVSCPVHALDVQAPLFDDEVEAPFVRRTTLTLLRSLRQLVSAIELDALDQLVASSKEGGTASVSSNLCEALTRFGDDTLKNSVEIGVAWAASIPPPAGQDLSSVVRIQHDYFAKIEQVRRALRPSEQHLDIVYPGTVERLDGTMGDDGQRAGEVILSLLTPDGEQLRVRAALDATQYAEADKAHMTDGAFVKVAGRLHPGRQPRQLSDIKSFQLMAAD